MPYKLNINGARVLTSLKQSDFPNFFVPTELQKKALEYLASHQEEERFIGAAEIAKFYGYPDGQTFRGVLASLHHYSLIDKKEE